MTDRNVILYLFHRLAEPIFISKGEEKVTFDIPAEYLVSQKLLCFLLIIYIICDLWIQVAPKVETNVSKSFKISSIRFSFNLTLWLKVVKCHTSKMHIMRKLLRNCLLKMRVRTFQNKYENDQIHLTIIIYF